MPPLVPVACAPCGDTALDCATDSVTICEIASESTIVFSVPASLTTVTLSAADATRRGLAVFNNSSADIYIKMGAGASTSSFTFKGTTNSYFEVPFNYTGIVTAVWGTASGSAEVTEVFN